MKHYIVKWVSIERSTGFIRSTDGDWTPINQARTKGHHTQIVYANSKKRVRELVNQVDPQAARIEVEVAT